MRRSRLAGPVLAAAFAISYLGMPGAANAAGYNETDLVVGGPDATLVAGVPTLNVNGVAHSAQLLDKNNLVNSWGLTSTGASQFWISDNGSGRSTTYVVTTGTPPTVSTGTRNVSIPSPGDPLGASGTPTGAAFNPTGEFKIFGVQADCMTPTSAPAIFLFATEDGTITGWNPTVFPKGCTTPQPAASPYAIIAVDNSARGQGGGKGVGTGKGKGNGLGAVYKGLAIPTPATTGGSTFLYVTNFRAGRVEKYDGTFALVDTFTDKKVPPRYAPFNISPIDGKLFVTFAVQNAERHDDVAGPGNGIVDTFDLSGNMLQRFAEGGGLNSPWGMAVAPSGFGEQSGKLLIGNFGDGRINAFDPVTGASGGTVNKPTTPPQPIVIDGLWALSFGNGGGGGSTTTLFFTAGPNGEADGLFGGLSAN